MLFLVCCPTKNNRLSEQNIKSFEVNPACSLILNFEHEKPYIIYGVSK